ncbi:MAG TPA: ChbG/HpnK family deacetylase, partial [Anaerolineales bacterium]
PNLNVGEVKAEWRFQIERFVQTTGHNPTHLDSHHHSSFFSAELFRGMLELAEEYECAIRYPYTSVYSDIEEASRHAPHLLKEFDLRHPDVFISDFYDDGATQDALLVIIRSLGDGVSELMCHPGYVDDAFVNESIYNHQRERELKILTDPAVKQAIQASNIELITFAGF